MKYWLMKTEPNVFSWDDLKNMPQQTTPWEGVRNYQARNFMRDEMKLGDRIFFYHSNVKPQVIMGIAKIARAAYPDSFAFDPSSPYYDPKSSPEVSRWLMVDVQFESAFGPPITLDELKQWQQRSPELQDMMLLQKGCRLSVQPVTPQQWQVICSLRP
jgi:predicted RNA-binding protein with PUA-like domain